MKFTAFSAVSLAVFLNMGPVAAQGLRNADAPAEFPPATYKSTQYVDSRGCVYVRAGIDGAVTWVPRVGRDRKVICGYKPTGGAAVAAAAPAAKAPSKAERITLAPSAQPAQVAVAAPTISKAPVVAAAPAAQPVVKRSPQTAATRQPMKTIASITTAPKVMAPPVQVTAPRIAVAAPRTVVAASAPSATRVVRVAPSAGAVQPCALAGTYGTQNSRAGAMSDVRCGPQSQLPYTSTPVTGGNTYGGQQVVTGGVAAPTYQRVAPRHVYELQQNALGGVPVPEGYRAVWDDDRLSTHRAHQTLAGKAKMELVWTNTVPRRLINRYDGQDVTALYPTLTPPPVTRVVTPVISTSGKVVAPRASQQVVRKASAPQPAASGKRYVQVGTFGVEANARNTANRLAASGLPVRMGSLTRAGKSYRLVMVGPLATSEQMNSALSAVRRAGFKDAFLR